MKTELYDDFSRKLHLSARAQNQPLRVMFELTYACNFKCEHCYIPESYRRLKTLNTKQVFDVIRQLKDAGCFYLGFTGGEIFTRPDIKKILKFSSRQGFQTILYSNGSLITKHLAEYIVDLGTNKIDITVPGLSRQVFEKISGLKGSYKKVFSAIGYLMQYKANLGLKTCRLGANAKEIKGIQDFAADLGVKHRLTDRLLAPWKPLTAVGALKCGSGNSQCAITPDGKLKLCVMLNWPKIKIAQNRGFSKAWAGLTRRLKKTSLHSNCPCAYL